MNVDDSIKSNSRWATHARNIVACDTCNAKGVQENKDFYDEITRYICVTCHGTGRMVENVVTSRVCTECSLVPLPYDKEKWTTVEWKWYEPLEMSTEQFYGIKTIR